MATGGPYMSMPVSNSLGVQLCMTPDYHNGAYNYNPQVTHTQYSSVARSRPKSGKSNLINCSDFH